MAALLCSLWREPMAQLRLELQYLHLLAAAVRRQLISIKSAHKYFLEKVTVA